MPKKETRYGKQGYVRRKVRNPLTGAYVAVYGRTVGEREEKIRALEAEWARQLRVSETPYFYEYAAAWFNRVRGDMSARRQAEIAREINNNICPVIGDKLLPEISADDCLDVMARRSGLSRAAQEKTLQTLRRILSAAEAAGKIPRNPAGGLKAGGAKGRQTQALTPEQQTRLLEAVRGLPVDLFVRLGLFAGLRREEICGLQWQDVTLEGPAPHLRVRRACRWPDNNRPEISEKLKSEAAWRTVPIPPPLLTALTSARAAVPKSAQKAAGGRTVLCTASGQPWTYQAFRSAWGAIEARTARQVTRTVKDTATGERVQRTVQLLPGDPVFRHPGVVISLDFPVTPHQLRHTYITRLILGGVDVKRVQYLAGHETADVTLDIYTSIMGHRPEELIDDVSAIFPE